MSPPRIVVTRRIPEPVLDLLRAAGDTWVSPHDRPLDAAELRDVVSYADAIVTLLHDRVDTAFLDAAGERLRVDEAALVDALRNGVIAGAGLDVYEHEPTVHPGLLELENVVLLPHLVSATTQTRTAMAVLAARNVVAVLGGAEPLTPVGPPRE